MSFGFFNKQTNDNPFFGKRENCHVCKLSKMDIATKGKGRRGIVILDEQPTERDRNADTVWAGIGGRLLKQLLSKYGIDLYEDCTTIYSVNCFSKIPTTPNHIDACRYKVWKSLQELQPKLLLVCGSKAVESIIGHRWKKNLGSIEKWRGWVIPDQDLKCWVAPLYHPDHVAKAKELVLAKIFETDLKKALPYMDKPWERSKKFEVEIIDDLTPLKDIKTGMVAVDYETTGIKPQARGHRIVCASVADTPDHCYAFKMPTTKQERLWFLNLMYSENIQKMAHNMKFEDTWTVHRLRQPVRNWYWDSMLAAHILDNRPDITGLKFQTYVHFGVVDYDSDISPYLKSVKKGGNELNRVLELMERFGGAEQLLTYCGMDTIYQFRLALRQMELMKYDDLPF